MVEGKAPARRITPRGFGGRGAHDRETPTGYAGNCGYPARKSRKGQSPSSKIYRVTDDARKEQAPAFHQLDEAKDVYTTGEDSDLIR